MRSNASTNAHGWDNSSYFCSSRGKRHQTKRWSFQNTQNMVVKRIYSQYNYDGTWCRITPIPHKECQGPDTTPSSMFGHQNWSWYRGKQLKEKSVENGNLCNLLCPWAWFEGGISQHIVRLRTLSDFQLCGFVRLFWQGKGPVQPSVSWRMK